MFYIYPNTIKFFMQEMELIPEKVFQYLLDLLDVPDTQPIHDAIKHSNIYFVEKYNDLRTQLYIAILMHPDIYKKHQKIIENIKDSVMYKYEDITSKTVDKIKILPDLDRYQIIENRLTPIATPWKKINDDQEHILKLLKSTEREIDFQNVGNACRELLKDLIKLIFNKDKHVANGIDLGENSYKNRIETYIRVELGGKQNEDFKGFVISLIDTCTKSINLANNVTHDKKANSMLAESAVISTFTLINIVKMIHK